MPKFSKDFVRRQGRPRGCRNWSTRVREAITAADGRSVLAALVSKARKGDVAAARALLPHLLPPGTYVRITLPPIRDAAGIAAAQDKVLADAGRERISLEAAERLAVLIEYRRRSLETVEIERNLQQTGEALRAREQADARARR